LQVFGLSTVPVAGEEFEVLDSLEVARERAEQCGQDARLTRLAARAAEGKVTLASLATSVVQGTDAGVERHQMNVILKVDVQVLNAS
jgi:translation initiation factor IF-2